MPHMRDTPLLLLLPPDADARCRCHYAAFHPPLLRADALSLCSLMLADAFLRYDNGYWRLPPARYAGPLASYS